MNFLVTGGSGFLGRRIVDKLLARGDQVAVLSRGDYPDLSAAGVEVIRGDISEPDVVSAACTGRDVVMHVAAKAGYWGAYSDYYRTNVIGTQNVLNACHDGKVPKLVYTSSPSVVFDGQDLKGVDETTPYASNPQTHYQKTKIEAEKMVLAANGKRGIETVALRPHVIFGPGDNHIIPRLVARARAGKLKIVGDGTNEVGVVYIDNAAEAHIQAAMSDAVSGKAYFITQTEPVVFWRWINEILGAFGLEPVNRRISFGLAYGVGAFLEAMYTTLRLPGEPIMTRFLAGQLGKSHYFDISNATRDFGYDPTVSTAEGVKRLAESGPQGN